MISALKHYSLLSLLSAFFFFGVFHAVAQAQTSAPIPSPTTSLSPTPSTVPAIPTVIPVTLEPTAIPTVLPTSTPEPTATPEPTPIPTIAIASPSDLETFFTKYSEEYHTDKELMKKIALCESGFNSQADTGTYAGMFQFVSQTWVNTRNRMGLDSNPDLRKNAEESIRTTAFMLSNGQQNAWANCL